MRFAGRALTRNKLGYIQGAYDGKVREYFYFISHEGRLFLDDTKHKNFTSSYKDVQFLNFFYRMLKENSSDKWAPEFPWISRCGIERNFVRADDRPVVYTKLDRVAGKLKIGESALEVDFEPNGLSVGARNGRLYHPSRIGIGLVASRLADELFPHCRFNEEGRAVELRWRGQLYPMGIVQR